MNLKSIIPLIGGSDTDKGEEHDGQDDNIDPEMMEKLDEASSGEKVVLSKDATSLVPDEMQIYRDYIVANNTYFRTFVVDDWPPRIQQDLFAGIIKSATLNFDFSLHLEPYGDQEAIDKIESLNSKISDKRSGEFSRFVSNKESMATTEKTLSAMKQHITQGEKLFDVSFYITIKSNSKEKLEEDTDELKNKLTREARLGLNHCRYQQEAGLVSNSPVSVNSLADKNDSFKQMMLSNCVANTFPFMEDTFMEEDGVIYGINENSMTPVFVDIFARSNGYNQLTTGMIGSGKTFSTCQVLLEMERAYTDFQQFIVDPMGDFQGINNALGGKRIIVAGSESINPLEIQKTPDHVMERAQNKLDPWGMKKQELRWFFTEFFFDPENEEGMSSHEKAMLDQAITQTYNQAGITQDVETHSRESPTILDLIDTLEMMAEDAAEFSGTDLQEEADKRRETAISLLLRMEPFKEGGEYHNLAQPTEIDIKENDVIYLDLQQIPEESDNLGIMMQLLFMKIYQNAKSTEDKVGITIDEAHKILGDENITGGLEELFRHSRHFNISINLISQTPEEFYVNQTAETIAKQCTIKRFHRVDSLNNDLVENKLELNQREVDFIENAEMGEGDKDYSEALLTIQDDDRSIPLRIEATKDEEMVIGYDPTESIREYNTQSQQRLKLALDTYNKNDNPVLIDEDNDLVENVKSQIIQKRRKRRQTIAEEDPSLLTEAEKESMREDKINGKRSESGTQQSGKDGNRSSISGVQNNTNSNANKQDATAREKIKSQLSDPNAVRSLSDNQLDRIAKQYGLKEENDTRKDVEDKVIADLFGEEKISNSSSDESQTESSEKSLGEMIDGNSSDTTNREDEAGDQNPFSVEKDKTVSEENKDIGQIKQEVGDIINDIEIDSEEQTSNNTTSEDSPNTKSVEKPERDETDPISTDGNELNDDTTVKEPSDD